MADNSLGAVVGVPVVVPVIGPWTAFTPSYNGLTVTAATGMYRRIGDSMEVVTQADPNGAAAGTITVTVPLGLTINTAQLTGTGATLGNLGTAQARPLNGASATTYGGIVQYASANSVAILGIGTVKSTDTASGLWNATIPDTWAATGDSISLHFTIPILEWAGSASVAYGAGLATSVKSGLVSYEDSGSFVSAYSGPFASTNLTIEYVRVGKQVTLNFPAAFIAQTTASALTIGLTNMPSSLRPAAIKDFITRNINATADVVGFTRIPVTGDATAYSTVGGGNFSGGGSCGMEPTSVTYKVP